ncbi:MAG TPA: aminotransferase class V-fold PLP-dependent enzyme [Candidatus Dormibacteraeota bacterium]|nr:aminotransferase class V-fold PLP-dependent enzyme [Candidatus Dormibacteraeota bacterium]
MLSDSEIRHIRSRFRIFDHKIYLNSCSQGALSDSVEASFREHLESWHEQGSPWDLWVQKYEEARGRIARFIGAEKEEIAIVPSASAGINSVASAVDFTCRRKVVLGVFEFPTMGHIWLAQQRRGAKVEFISARGDRIPAESYTAAVDHETAIVPVTHVCFMNGFRSDVAGIIGLAHSKGALVFMDDYQDCGTRPVNVKAWDVDFYVSGALKYLLGPSGIAFLYVRRNLIPSLVPTISGWFGQQNPFAFDVRLHDLASTARRFEAGTPPIPNIYAAMAGIALLGDIGLEHVESQIRKLAQALIEGARELGFRIKTPLDSVGPLVVLQSNNVEAVLARLAEQNIICSGRHDGLRISFHVHNTLDDVRAVLKVLKKCSELIVRERQTA